MALNVGQLFASLQLNTQQFFNSLTRSQEAFRRFGDSLKNMGMKMSLAISLPLVALGYKSIKAASDLNENMNKVKEVFKENSDEVVKWSENTLKSIGLAQSTALDMVSVFGDMGTSMGLTRKGAAEMSMGLVNLAGDMASFKNMDFESIQTALSAVFTGETESLKRFGVVMTEENLKEFAAMETKIANLKQVEKVQLRYAFILDKTRNAQGDFNRTADGAANQMRIFQESVKQLSASFGQVMLPMFTKIITKVNELIQNFSKLSDTQKSQIVKWGLLAIAVGPVLFLMGTLLTTISSMITIFTALSTLIAGITSTMLVWTAVIIGAIAVGVGLGLAAVIIKDNWKSLNDWFNYYCLSWVLLFKLVADGIVAAFKESKKKIIAEIIELAEMVPGVKLLTDKMRENIAAANKPKEFALGDNLSESSISSQMPAKAETSIEKIQKDMALLIASAKLMKEAEGKFKEGAKGTFDAIYKELKDEILGFSLDDLLKVNDKTGKKAIDAAKKTTDEIIKAMKAGISGLSEPSEKMKKEMDSMIDKVKQLAEAFKQSLGGLFDAIQPSKKISSKKLILLQNAKTKMLEEFQSTMSALGERLGFNSETFNAIMKEGVGGLGSAKNILKMNAPELQRYQESVEKQSRLSWKLGGMQAESMAAQEKAINNVAVNLNGGVYVGNMKNLADLMVKELKAQGVFAY